MVMLKPQNAVFVTTSEHDAGRGLHWEKVTMAAHDGSPSWLQSAVDDVMIGMYLHSRQVRWGFVANSHVSFCLALTSFPAWS
jgi:hypothetical protein